MDKERRRQLIEKLNVEAPLVLLLEDFFVGNDDVASIGCNLDWEGGPSFFEPLKAIRAKPNVQNVLVQVFTWENDEDAWPFSDRIYIFSSASRDEVAEWLAPLEPDTVEEEKSWNATPKQSLEPGMKIYSAWWD